MQKKFNVENVKMDADTPIKQINADKLHHKNTQYFFETSFIYIQFVFLNFKLKLCYSSAKSTVKRLVQVFQDDDELFPRRPTDYHK